MSANYLHGVETIELNIGPRPIRVVKSAVIGLVGIAPKGPRQTLTLVQSQADAAQFGKSLPGFNIPHALEAIQKQGAGTVVVVNIFDTLAHTTQDTERITVTNGKARTSLPPIRIDNDGVAMTYTVQPVNDGVAGTAADEGDDYTVDEFGTITIVPSGALVGATSLDVTFSALTPSAISLSEIVGTVTNGVRTGMKLWDLCYQTFGFTPRLLISPDASAEKTIADELLVYADKFRAHAIIDDDPSNETVSAVITNRGDYTEPFGTSSKRAILAYPHLKAYDAYSNDNIKVPYSPYIAGCIAATDDENGYWFSFSNREIRGITGAMRTLTAAVNDPNTEVNLLNEAGIVTIFNSFGTGLRTWGNRSAAFPTSTDPSNFVSVQRVADIMHESIELAMLQFIDKPINNALIDAIRDSVNAFMSVLIQRGAIVDGSCTYDPAKNPPVELAAGHITFDLTFMPPTPAERITFESYIDINLLRNLGTNN